MNGIQLAPDHYWSLPELGPIYRRLQRHADADRVALRAAAVRPHSVKFEVEASRALMSQRDRSAVATRAPALLARVPASALTLDATAARTCTSSRLGCVGQDATWLRLWKMADWLDGDAPAALEALREADRQYAGQPGSFWQYQLYFAYQGLGRFGDARRVALRMPDEMRRFFVPLIEARLEDRAAFDRVAGDLRSFDVRDGLSYMLIWVGRLGDARRLAEERRHRATGELLTGGLEFEGHLRHAEGRHREAVEILEAIARDATAPRLRMNEVLASARRGMGDVQGAIGTLAFTNRRAVAVLPNYAMYDWLRARVLLMELYREAGWVSQAEEVEAEVRQLLAVADANHPLFRRLR